MEIWGREGAVAPGQAHCVGLWGSLLAAWEPGAGLATYSPCTGVFAEVFQGGTCVTCPSEEGTSELTLELLPSECHRTITFTPGYCNHSSVCIITERF